MPDPVPNDTIPSAGRKYPLLIPLGSTTGTKFIGYDTLRLGALSVKIPFKMGISKT